MKYVALSPDDVATALHELPGWSFSNDRLERSLKFSSFGSAIRFMAACVPVIDQLDHHPTWSNTYSSVSIALTSHDVGNKVTAVDVALAKAIEDVLAREGEALGYRAG